MKKQLALLSFCLLAFDITLNRHVEVLASNKQLDGLERAEAATVTVALIKFK
jgi:hypothetical protein